MKGQARGQCGAPSCSNPNCTTAKKCGVKKGEEPQQKPQETQSTTSSTSYESCGEDEPIKTTCGRPECTNPDCQGECTNISDATGPTKSCGRPDCPNPDCQGQCMKTSIPKKCPRADCSNPDCQGQCLKSAVEKKCGRADCPNPNCQGECTQDTKGSVRKNGCGAPGCKNPKCRGSCTKKRFEVAGGGPGRRGPGGGENYDDGDENDPDKQSGRLGGRPRNGGKYDGDEDFDEQSKGSKRPRKGGKYDGDEDFDEQSKGSKRPRKGGKYGDEDDNFSGDEGSSGTASEVSTISTGTQGGAPRWLNTAWDFLCGKYFGKCLKALLLFLLGLKLANESWYLIIPLKRYPGTGGCVICPCPL